jgi:hypothetical protein
VSGTWHVDALAIVQKPAHGTVTVNGRSLTCTVNAGYVRKDQFVVGATTNNRQPSILTFDVDVRGQ